MNNDIQVGQLCKRKDDTANFYYLGERKIRSTGKIVQVFKKFEKNFYSGFYTFNKLSEFDELFSVLNKQSINHFLENLNKEPMFSKI